MLLEDALHFGGLASARVVAGQSGLSSPIVSVSVLEIAEESVSTWTMENQLFITSFYAIRNNIAMQRLVIETLAKCRCCGLVVCHIRYVLKSLDPSILALCDQLGFPLIVADSDVSFIDIINPIYSKLSLPAHPLTFDEMVAQNDFIDLIISERSPTEILKLIAYKIGHEVSFFDIYFNCLYSNKNEIKKEKEQKHLHEHLGWNHEDVGRLHYHFMDTDQGRRLIYYVKKNHLLFGFICLECGPNESDAHVLELVNRLNLPCALLFSKTRNLQDAMRDYQQIYISDLLVWNFRTNELALSRGRELDLDISGKHYAITVNLNDYPEDTRLHRDLDIYIQRWYMPNLQQLVQSYALQNIVYFRSDVIIILLEQPLDFSEVKALADRILTLFVSGVKISVSIGISNRFENIDEIPKAYNESFDVAILGRKLYGVNHVATFQDLGLFVHMKTLKNFPSVQKLCAQIVAPLRQHDLTRGTELMPTARALFENNLDTQKTAQALHIHRNTLLYRKNQIEQIMGYDVFALPYSFNFMAALFIEGML